MAMFNMPTLGGAELTGFYANQSSGLSQTAQSQQPQNTQPPQQQDPQYDQQTLLDRINELEQNLTQQQEGQINYGQAPQFHSAQEVEWDDRMSAEHILDRMVNTNSDFVQHARNQGMQQAAGRGLLNSSMAAGMAQNAVYENAVPVALQDASTFSGVALSNASAVNQMRAQENQFRATTYLSHQDYQQTRSLADQQYGHMHSLAEQSFRHNMQLQDAAARHQQELISMQMSLQKSLEDARREHDITMTNLQAEIRAAESAQNFEYAQLLNQQQNELSKDFAQLQSGLQQDLIQLEHGLQQNAREQEQLWQSQERELDRLFQEQQSVADFERTLEQMGYANELDNYNVGNAFAASTAQQTMNNIQLIQADPNLDEDAKSNAIQNAVDIGNETLAWGSTFYNTPLPSMTTPESVQSMITPQN
ncbi:hypothetical protein [uncultured Halomonas sp.]|uniref:hypothetical protein n=1 Tax=uncultured Halomonas sp. TaxID=173971 RepID=UPI0026288932|nr:hypothetical protein [uncultured Halomonas sp.]